MRDLMMLGALFILLGLSFRNIYAAYLIWCWAGLIAAQSYLYGFMRVVPYVQIFALISLMMLLLGKDKEKISFPGNGASILMALFSFHCIMAAWLAFPWLARNWELCTNVLKTILFCLVMPMVITRRYRFHAILVTVVIGTSFHGLLDGLKFVASGGGHKAIGIQKFGDNNHMAMILIMVMPLILYLYQYAKYKLARLAYGGVFFVTCLAIVATGSRGALITLLAVGAWLILLSRRKAIFITIAVFVGTLIVALAPASWSDRMSTIQDAEHDSSFMGRVIAWKRASAIALDHPIYGGGFHAGQDPQLYLDYNGQQGLLGFVETPLGHYAAATHSIYFEVLGDLGFLGLLLFMLLMFYPFWIRLQIKHLAKTIGETANWARDCSDMLAASMLAFLVGGAALSAAYFELPYIIVMVMQVLYLVLKREQTAAAQAEHKLANAGLA